MSVVLIRDVYNTPVCTGILIKPNKVLSVASLLVPFLKYYDYKGLNVLTSLDNALQVLYIEIHTFINSKISLEKYNIAVITVSYLTNF